MFVQVSCHVFHFQYITTLESCNCTTIYNMLYTLFAAYTWRISIVPTAPGSSKARESASITHSASTQAKNIICERSISNSRAQTKCSWKTTKIEDGKHSMQLVNSKYKNFFFWLVSVIDIKNEIAQELQCKN